MLICLIILTHELNWFILHSQTELKTSAYTIIMLITCFFPDLCVKLVLPFFFYFPIYGYL